MKDQKLIFVVLTCIVSLTAAEFTSGWLFLITSLTGWLTYAFLIGFLIYSLVKYLRTKMNSYLTTSVSVLAFLLTFHLAGPSPTISYFDGNSVFQGGCEHTMDWVHLVLLENNDAFMWSGMKNYNGRRTGEWVLKNDTVYLSINNENLVEKYKLVIRSDAELLSIEHNTRGHNHQFRGNTRRLAAIMYRKE